MKFVLILGAVLLAILLAPFVIGSFLPLEHTVSKSVALEAPTDEVFALLTDVEDYALWRSGLKSVEVLDEEPLRFRESGSYGDVVFEEVSRNEPDQIVIRIAEDDQPYGGQWTYDLASSADGCELTTTEDGWVKSPYYRFMSKYMFGYDSTIAAYLTDVETELTRE